MASLASTLRIVAAALVAASLAPPAPASADGGGAAPSYTDADYAPYAPDQTGPGRISGELVLRGPGGTIAAAGALVAAFPDTPYTRWYLGQRHDAMNQQGGVLPKQNPDSVIVYPTYDDKIVPDVRTTTSDARGRFSFSKLPKGNYIVVGQFATVATKYMPSQQEDASYGAVNVDDFHAPPPSEYAENYFYFWMVGSKPVTAGSAPVNLGALKVYNAYFCGMLQRCTLVNDFATKGEGQGDKINRALGIGAKHGFEKRQYEPVSNPNDGVRAG